jgi:hypothetical protein
LREAAGPQFYEGLGGVLFVMKRAESALGSARAGRAVSRLVAEVLASSGAEEASGLLGGVAGALLGACAAAELAPGRTATLVLRRYASQIVDTARSGGDCGVFWDPAARIRRGLCGVAHGAAGISLALLQASKLLGAGELAWLAAEGLRYEDGEFEQEKGGWPDHRCTYLYSQIGMDFEAMREELLRPRRGELLAESPAALSWCNGSAGCGLVRLRASADLGDGRYRSTALEVAVGVARNLTRTPRVALSWLCCGLAGTGMFLLRVAREYGARVCEEAAWTCAEICAAEATKYISQKKNSGAQVIDLSLFSGVAGIGMFLVELLFERSPADVLCPSFSPCGGETVEGVSVCGFKAERKLQAIRGRLVRSAVPDLPKYTIDRELESEEGWHVVAEVCSQILCAKQQCGCGRSVCSGETRTRDLLCLYREHSRDTFGSFLLARLCSDWWSRWEAEPSGLPRDTGVRLLRDVRLFHFEHGDVESGCLLLPSCYGAGESTETDAWRLFVAREGRIDDVSLEPTVGSTLRLFQEWIELGEAIRIGAERIAVVGDIPTADAIRSMEELVVASGRAGLLEPRDIGASQ